MSQQVGGSMSRQVGGSVGERDDDETATPCAVGRRRGHRVATVGHRAATVGYRTRDPSGAGNRERGIGDRRSLLERLEGIVDVP